MVRLKNRYIIMEVNPELSPSDSTESNYQPLRLNDAILSKNIQTKIQDFHGDFGMAAIRSGFVAKYINEHTRIAIIRSRQGPHKLVTSVLPFISSIDSVKVSINILYIGATLKKCFGFVKCYQVRKCDELCALMNSDEQKQLLRSELLDFKRIANSIEG